MMNVIPAIDKRLEDRRSLRVSATVMVSPTQSFEVRTMDISSGGMAICAAANPRTGTQFDISFQIPNKTQGSTPVQVRVRVAYSVLSRDQDGFKIGLQFVHLSPDSATTIGRYIMH